MRIPIVININLTSYLASFQSYGWLLDIGQIVANDRGSLHLKALVGVIPANNVISDISPKTRFVGYISVA